jgi:hypothetical protein
MRYPVLLLAFFIPLILSAQKNFKPGYVVNLKGDTSSGFIDYREWDFSPSRILFKPSGANANAREYTANDLRLFDIIGNEAYHRFIVNISLHPLKLSDISGKDTSWKTDTVFLKVIHAGKIVSLYAYSDRIKERFYILKEGLQQPTELVVREYLKDGSMSLITEDTYKDQLIGLLNANDSYTDKLLRRISEASYDEGDLKKIIRLMNGTDQKELVEEKERQRVNWFAGAGLQRDKLSFGGDHVFAKYPTTTNSSWLPTVSAGFDFFANPKVGKLFYRIEAGYQINKSSIIANMAGNVKWVYELSNSTVFVQPQLNYTVYNTAKLKIPVGVGFRYSLINYSKNYYKKSYPSGDADSQVDNYLDLRKGVTTLLARISVVFHNKIEASFLYQPSATLTKTVAYGMSTNNMHLQIYFLFRQKK